MSGALICLWPGAPSLEGLAPCVEERWLKGSNAVRRRITTATVLVLVVSFVMHVGLVATAMLRDATPAPHTLQETSVEVVSEVPNAVAAPEIKTTEVKAAEIPSLAVPAAQPELKPSLPPHAVRQPPEPPRPDADLKALQDELASLRAEHDALEATPAAPLAAAASLTPSGLGLLADSFQAVAMPSSSEAGDLPVGYAAIVFSQLAKAKEIGGEMGQPGTAGVSFSIDEKGVLTGAEVVTSSGIKKLDDEAISIVHKAAPFPPPPPGAQRSFSANVSFVGKAGP